MPEPRFDGKTFTEWVEHGLAGHDVPDEVRNEWLDGRVGWMLRQRQDPPPTPTRDLRRQQALLQRAAKAVKTDVLGRQGLREAPRTPLSRFMAGQLAQMRQVPGDLQGGNPAALARTLKARWDSSRELEGWHPVGADYFEGVIVQLQRDGEARRTIFHSKRIDSDPHPALRPWSGREIAEARAQATAKNNRDEHSRRWALFKLRRTPRPAKEERATEAADADEPGTAPTPSKARRWRLRGLRLDGRGLASQWRDVVSWRKATNLPLLGRLVSRVPGFVPAAVLCWLALSFVNVIWEAQAQQAPVATYWWHAAAALTSALVNLVVAAVNAILFGLSTTFKVFVVALFEIITQVLALALGSLYAAVNKLIEVTRLGTGTLGPPRLNTDAIQAGTWFRLNYLEPGTISSCGDGFVHVVGCRPWAELVNPLTDPAEPVLESGSHVSWASWDWATSTWTSLWQLASTVGTRSEEAWTWLTGGQT